MLSAHAVASEAFEKRFLYLFPFALTSAHQVPRFPSW